MTKLLPPQYGTTLPHSYLSCCPDRQLISSTEDFHARISVLLELEQAWKESDQDYFTKSYDYVACFDRDSFSWKMSQLSLFEVLTEFSWSSLRWGMTVDGRLYQPQNLVPRTCERDGLCLPTPTASMAGTNGKTWNEETQSWINGKPSLNMMATHGMLSTPTARDWKDGKNPKQHGRHSPSIGIQMAQNGHKGYLNPQFVEMMMGYGTGWTALEDWAMQWFHSKPKKRLKD